MHILLKTIRMQIRWQCLEIFMKDCKDSYDMWNWQLQHAVQQLFTILNKVSNIKGLHIRTLFEIFIYHLGLAKMLWFHGEIQTKEQFLPTPGLSGFWDQSQANSALYSAFWSVEPTDFKNVIVENIHWALFEDAEVAEVKRPRNSKRQKFYYKKW